MTMMNFVSHGTQDMYPTFLQRDRGFNPSLRAALTAFSMVGALTGGVLAGLASDRIGRRRAIVRSEEHTSELQSRLHLVCRLLLEKKKKYRKTYAIAITHDGS